MGFPLLPLIALFGGAVAIAGKKKKKASGSKRNCSPASVFGVSYAPMDESMAGSHTSSSSTGGYPIYAMNFVAQWAVDNPKSFTARYLKSRESWAKSFMKSYAPVQAKIDRMTSEGKSWHDYEFGQAIDLLEKMKSDFYKRRAGAQSYVWKAAQEICSSIGCQVKKSGDNRVSAIISDDRQWTLWLMALGVYMNLPSNRSVISKHSGFASEEMGSYKNMIGDFLGREIAGELSDLSEDLGKTESEMARYGSVVGPMMKPRPEALSKLESNVDNGSWMFNDVRTTGVPFNDIEEKGLDVLSDVWKFFTGKRGIVVGDNRDVPDKILYGWLSIDLIGSPPKTVAGMLLMVTLSPGGNRSTVFPAFSELENSETIRSIAMRNGIDLMSSVRTQSAGDWWTGSNGSNTESGKDAARYCVSQAPSRKEEYEQLAIALLSNRFACDQDPDGGYDYARSPLVDIYPDYATFFEKNPVASYEEYDKAMDSFKWEYPIAYLAISNLMNLLVREFDLSWEGSDVGFGG